MKQRRVQVAKGGAKQGLFVSVRKALEVYGVHHPVLPCLYGGQPGKLSHAQHQLLTLGSRRESNCEMDCEAGVLKRGDTPMQGNRE